MERKEKRDNKIAIIMIILVISAIVISIMCMQKKIYKYGEGTFLRSEQYNQSVFANISIGDEEED